MPTRMSPLSSLQEIGLVQGAMNPSKCAVCSSEYSDPSDVWPAVDFLPKERIADWNVDWKAFGAGEERPFGCFLCAAILAVLSTIDRFECGRVSRALVKVYKKHQQYLLTIDPVRVNWPPGSGVVTVHPCISFSCGSDFEPFYDIPRDRDSQQSLELARGWFSNCRTNHTQCGLDSHTYIPSRLLDVSAVHPRLVLRAEVSDRVSFMALSHCWGGSQQLRTTSHNWDSHREGIPLAQFPLTLRDAIKITRLFGFEYIWIDSICIIQDSVADWEEESSQMDKVYGQAELVLAASAARNSDDGFLEKSKVIPQGSISLSRNDQSEALAFKFRVVSGHIGRDPLDGRAWGFQERLMARRYLSYGEQELAWECCEGSACECGWVFTQPLPSEHLRNLNAMSETTTPEHWIDDLWNRRIVWQYCKMSLSVPSDKLVALSAVASRIQTVFGGTYLAGLWKEDILCELLWDCQLGRPENFRAPTWSWVSVSSVLVQCHNRGLRHSNKRELVRIVGTYVVLSTKNIFGSVSFGTITIYGKLISTRVRGRAPRNPITPSCHILAGLQDHWEVYCCPDMALVTYESDAELSTRRILYEEEATMPNDWRTATEFPVWILPMLQGLNSHNRDFLTGLALGRSKAQPACFERLGKVFLSQTSDGSSGREFLKQYPDQEVVLV
ncbi:HET-domain-containing protein [Xylariaceae sp. AK1471]|nr:HET-domain-containing protein [Xylariaceae sp. AK1471]